MAYFFMNFLEKNLEDIIYDTDNKFLNERGLPISGKKYRQFRLGGYGVADLITVNKTTYVYDHKYEDDMPTIHRHTDITIYELKKENIQLNALLQCVGYAKGVARFLNHLDILNKYEDSINIRIVLIGKNIDTSDNFCYIPDVFHNVSFYTYDYQFDGISFNKHDGYKLTTPYFKNYRKHG